MAVVNTTQSDMWLKPQTRLGILRPVQVLGTRDLQVEVNNSEIVVSNQSLLDTKSPEKMDTPRVPLVDLSNFPGTSVELQQVTELFSRHANVFAKSDDDLGCTKAVQHRIRTTDDTRNVVMPYRRIPPTQLEKVKDHLQKLLRNSCIVESQSDSAVVLVRMRSGALRLCCDYRALNAKTIKDAHRCYERSVYLRNHAVKGRNKIQDAWDSKVYRVVSRQGTNHVYVVEPAGGFGEQRTINRAEIRPCTQPTEGSRHCNLLCAPTSDTDIESDGSSSSSSTPWMCSVPVDPQDRPPRRLPRPPPHAVTPQSSSDEQTAEQPPPLDLACNCWVAL